MLLLCVLPVSIHSFLLFNGFHFIASLYIFFFFSICGIIISLSICLEKWETARHVHVRDVARMPKAMCVTLDMDNVCLRSRCALPQSTSTVSAFGIVKHQNKIYFIYKVRWFGLGVSILFTNLWFVDIREHFSAKQSWQTRLVSAWRWSGRGECGERHTGRRSSRLETSNKIILDTNGVSRRH